MYQIFKSKKIRKTVFGLVKRLLIFCLFVGLTLVVIAYARGYRFEIGQKASVSSRGIISVSASPKAAKVYVNDQLKGVTDLNLTLPPGQYKIEVKKDGYTNWSRTVNLKGELVVTLDVLLFPLNPSLSPLTNLGINKIIPIGDTGKLLLFSDNDDATKDGIYLFEPTQGPLSFLPPLKLLVLKSQLNSSIDLSKTDVTFSPDLKQGIFNFNDESSNLIVTYLLSTQDQNNELFDVTSSKDVLMNAWSDEREKETARVFEAFPGPLQKVASDSVHIISISPDDTKILYRAVDRAELPAVITPPLIASDQTPETRAIQPPYIYVYDKKEDRNYLIQSDTKWISQLRDLSYPLLPSPTPKPLFRVPTQTPQVLSENLLYWYPDSKHLVMNDGSRIEAVGFDGGDKRTVYSGPLEGTFFSVTNDGSIIIMANLNPQNNLHADLYLVGIK